jgi:Ca-activated chloride channel homolog
MSRPEEDDILWSMVPTTGTLVAPTEAFTGSKIMVRWTGSPPPDESSVLIAVGLAHRPEYESSFFLDTACIVELLMPPRPGNYSIRYIVLKDHKVMTSVPIKLVDAAATLTAPEQAVIGPTISVQWTGPEDEGDCIAIGRNENDYEQRTFLDHHTNTVDLPMPTAPGNYFVFYHQMSTNKALARIPIVLAAAEATLSAPPQAVIGSTINVKWTGPGYSYDILSIGLASQKPTEYIECAFLTASVDTVEVLMPTVPGDYVICYRMFQDRIVLTSVAIVLVAAKATLEAPPQAAHGSTITVKWTGPGYNCDTLSIGLASQKPTAYVERAILAASVDTVELLMPTVPGDYVICYMMFQDETVLASVPITIV